jgi:hypothetical protein
LKAFVSRLQHLPFRETPSPEGGVERVKNLRELRAKAEQCRLSAIREPHNRTHWLAEADRWLQLEQEEIADYFAECNVTQPTGQAA